MKKKFFTRPVSVSFSDDMFEQIKIITDTKEIGISDYIREAIAEKLEKTVSQQSHLNQEELEMNLKNQTYLTTSWKKVLHNNNDIIKLLKGVKITDLKKLHILSRTYSNDGRMIINVTADNADNKTFRIIIDSTPGIPTWQQFINVTYDQGESTDIRIILYGEDYRNYKKDFTAGGIFEISNLVRRNNKCGLSTYLVKGIDLDSNGQKFIDEYRIEEGPHDVFIDPTQTFPSKRQVQEAEFWTGYYFPQWWIEPIGIDNDIINCWAPGYSFDSDLRTVAPWNDEGFFIKLIEDKPSETIHWIWNNKKSEFETEYPGCDIILEKIDEDRHAISVRILNISMTDVINLDPDNKWNYGQFVFDQEHNFKEIVDGVVEDYDAMVKAAAVM